MPNPIKAEQARIRRVCRRVPGFRTGLLVDLLVNAAHAEYNGDHLEAAALLEEANRVLEYRAPSGPFRFASDEDYLDFVRPLLPVDLGLPPTEQPPIFNVVRTALYDLLAPEQAMRTLPSVGAFMRNRAAVRKTERARTAASPTHTTAFVDEGKVPPIMKKQAAGAPAQEDGAFEARAAALVDELIDAWGRRCGPGELASITMRLATMFAASKPTAREGQPVDKSKTPNWFYENLPAWTIHVCRDLDKVIRVPGLISYVQVGQDLRVLRDLLRPDLYRLVKVEVPWTTAGPGPIGCGVNVDAWWADEMEPLLKAHARAWLEASNTRFHGNPEAYIPPPRLEFVGEGGMYGGSVVYDPEVATPDLTGNDALATSSD